jgi:NAD(P)-dependent dehydrogenase (short-subunit alcohol dehydrogenase family)
MDVHQKNVLITGASSGIGEGCSLRLDALGYRVFAGVRKPTDGESLRGKSSGRLTPVSLEVTSADSISGAVAALGGVPLAGLVNNAGVAIAGPLELVPMDLWRRQMEVNVMGPVAVTQAFLPQLRAGRGRIVNIGSIAGRSALPLAGPYCASKHALEGLTDSLRMEVKRWGITVSIVEPGAVKTPIWDKSLGDADELRRQAKPDLFELYRALVEKMLKVVQVAARTGSPVEDVAKAVEHALTSARPKTRYVVGRDAKIRMLLNRLPDLTRDSLILKQIEKM